MKRVIIKLGVFLLLGAVVNVAVAWGSARLFPGPLTHRWNSQRSFGLSHEGDVYWMVSVDEITSGTTVHFYEMPSLSRLEEQDMRSHFTDDVVDLPSWSRATYQPRADQSEMRYLEEARGWPLLALMWQMEWRSSLNSGTAKAEGAIFFEHAIRNNSREKILPYTPIWLGFTVNTVFYAVVLWLPFAPFKLRRWRRIRRGLCIKCAYPIGTSDVCTECGAQISKTIRTRGRGSMSLRVANGDGLPPLSRGESPS